MQVRIQHCLRKVLWKKAFDQKYDNYEVSDEQKSKEGWLCEEGWTIIIIVLIDDEELF